MGQSSKGIWQRSGLDTRVNPDGYCSRINALRATPDACLAAAKRLATVLIEHDDAIEVMRRHDRQDALIYCDPPYLTPEGKGTGIYTHDFAIADHRMLAEALHSLTGMVILSGYPSDLYEELYGDWERHEREHMADGGRERTEVLWLNHACSAALTAARAQERLFA